MTVETFDINAQPLTVTPAAAEHFRTSLAARGMAAVRISVRSSGCTGFKYVMEEVVEGEDGDLSLELDNGIKVYLDDDAVAFMRGTQIDYTQEGVNRTLKFNNPNVVAECGCGESFNVE
ncbi:MAG: iron-sulfur cluster assembly accessory protein [Halieaceae bacterium]|jgi:iron-sulfur cluster assembly accessory protein|nr:iron-sulfur cluster assembly accessory protein [Halieaceae bacterium]